MVLMQEDKMIAGLVPEEGGGGHVIQNASGTAVAQEPTMQFTDSHVSDDSTNEKTVIENIKPLTGAEFDVVTEDGFYAITDEDDATMEDTSADYVEVTADGVKTYATLYNELFALVDESKITVNAILEQNGVAFSRAGYVPNSEIEFSYSAVGYQKPYIEMIRLKPSNSIIYRYSNDTFSDISSSVPTNGKTITLYYGTDSCVTDLINQAKYTYMESGESVESVIPKVLSYVDYTITSRTYTQSSYTQIEGSKTTFGLLSNAKIVNVTVTGNNGGLLCSGINDHESANWLRFRIHNIAGEDKTQTLPVRIWYQI